MRFFWMLASDGQYTFNNLILPSLDSKIVSFPVSNSHVTSIVHYVNSIISVNSTDVPPLNVSCTTIVLTSYSLWHYGLGHPHSNVIKCCQRILGLLLIRLLVLCQSAWSGTNGISTWLNINKGIWLVFYVTFSSYYQNLNYVRRERENLKYLTEFDL